MDADAYLKRHGWKGTGHALDHNGRGIKKPLLIAHKQDQLGLGQKKAAHRTDDQWWMRAFDESLKNIGTGQESTLSQVRKQGVNRGGLYGFFVKGEGLAGTVSNTEESSAAEASDSSTPKSRASTRATSASESSSDRDSDSDTKVSNNKSTIQKVVAPVSSVPTDSKKRKRGEEVAYDAQAAREAFIMKRIFKAVNKEVKKKLPEKHGKEETKESKILWQNARREARSELKKQMMVDAMMKGDLPNPKKYKTKEEALENYEKDQRAQNKAEKEGKKIAEETEAKSEEQEEVKVKSAKKDRKKRKLEADETPGEPVNVLLSPPKTERYTTTKENKPLSVDNHSTELELERSLPAITKKIAKLSAEERAQYEERAALKQQSLELYVLRRIQKKKEKNSAEATPSNPEAPFFVDLDGDKALLKALPPPPNCARKLDGTAPLDPSVWENRDVKDLTKEERSARRDHMRSQRPPKVSSKEETNEPQRQETKDALVAKLLADQGLKKGKATEEQKKEARSKARKLMKEGEREKKDEKKIARRAKRKE